MIFGTKVTKILENAPRNANNFRNPPTEIPPAISSPPGARKSAPRPRVFGVLGGAHKPLPPRGPTSS